MSRHSYASLAVIIIAAILAVGTSDSGGSSSPSDKPNSVDLNANVQFNGTQFVIANNDSFDWTNCKLEVNPEFLGSGFKYEGASLRAGETYSIGSLQLANGEGERFNPFTHKPQAFSIWCDTPSGKGFYYGAWK